MGDAFWETPLSQWRGRRVREFLEEAIREGDHLEYKAAPPFRDSGRWRVTDDLLETVCAMANAADGLILVGVADDASYPSGLTGLPNPAPEKALRDSCASNIEPAVRIDTSVVTVPDEDVDAGKQVMLVGVRRGPNPPYVLRDRGVYIRNDEHDRPARRADLDALYERRKELNGEPSSPWTTAVNAIATVPDQMTDRPGPVLGVALTPTFPQPRITVGNDQDRRFREIGQTMLSASGEPILEPGAVSMEPEPLQSSRLGFPKARAVGDGTIYCVRYVTGADFGERGVKNVGIVALWLGLRTMLEASAVWPHEVCGARGSLLYTIAISNLTGSRLVLPDKESLESSAIDRQVQAHVNPYPRWTARGEWDPEVSADDLLERLFGSLARTLQCTWWERLSPMVRMRARG